MINVTKEDLSQLDAERAFKAYRKTVPTMARQMWEPFKVETLEGVMEGKTGDYLCLDNQNNPYPCAKEVFEASYERV